MSPGSNTESYPAFAHIGLRKTPEKTSTSPSAGALVFHPGDSGSIPVQIVIEFLVVRADVTEGFPRDTLIFLYHSTNTFVHACGVTVSTSSRETRWPGYLIFIEKSVFADTHAEPSFMAKASRIPSTKAGLTLSINDNPLAQFLPFIDMSKKVAVLRSMKQSLRFLSAGLIKMLVQEPTIFPPSPYFIGYLSYVITAARVLFTADVRAVLEQLSAFVWSVALYGAETWALRRNEEKRIEAFEICIWRRLERVKWTDRIRNEAVLERMDEERMMLKLTRKRKRNWLGHWLRRNCLLKDALEGMENGRRVRGRRRYQMIDDIKIYGSKHLKCVYGEEWNV
ncbi:hypothetical protein ANN_22271 [Periplaneta americana]|uniref:Uncharacterized protein n=1 Tax=Periplaneta americana TaxID=6978 RepID=A0ABQ8S7P3_PERAM|nr:hypothetical protein ANN_22271 [Periplaneta americana]